ncbi:MAG: peptidoglycan editing factor PgeF [Bdellovibrio sp.]
MNLEQTQFGYEIRTHSVTVFMGGINSQFTNLTQAYPQFHLLRLKQVHGDSVVESNAQSPDFQTLADAHFTNEKNLALCVVTADCVPAFFYDSATGFIAGVHAGWRGVASRIIPATIKKLVQHGANLQTTNVFIGPHIQKPSFEVGNDVKDQILSSLGPLENSEMSLCAEKISNEKSLVDLSLVVKTQLFQTGIEAENIFDLHIDTVQNLQFNSYRRDKENSGRQISFICRTL